MPRSRLITQEGGALRRRVAHLLDTVSFDPPGMSPASILLVRRLADPLPRRFAPHPEAVRADSEWENAARSRLGEFHRRAARPIDGFVSGSAEAVLFSDRSEMLACLARDLISGNAAMLWWWRAILRTLPPGTMEALIAAWQREPRYIPAALHLLNARGEAVRVLNTFSPMQAWRILLEIAREFGIALPSPGEAPPIQLSPGPQDPLPADFGDERGRSVQLAETRTTRAISAPWHGLTFVRDVPDLLGREQSALLGMSLVLHHAPQMARSARFAERFSAWYRQADAPRIQPASAASITTYVPQSTEADPVSAPIAISLFSATEQKTFPGPVEFPPFDQQNLRLATGEAPSSAAAPERSRSVIPAAERWKVIESVPSRDTVATQGSEPVASQDPQLQRIDGTRRKSSLPMDAATQAGPAVSDVHALPPATESQTPHLPLSRIPQEEPVPTELGGVLFLVNLLRALKLPELLETEFGVGPISGWELLELLARSLLAQRTRSLANDGVWTLLAQLAGRSPEEPIAPEFTPRPSYQIPAFWMEAVPRASAHFFGVRLRGNHLQVWHQQGFMLADCLGKHFVSKAAVEQQCSAYCREADQPQLISWREIARSGLAGCVNVPVKRPTLRRFLAFLLPYVRWRLCRALGITNVHRLPEMLLLRHGRLYATRTHVDLTMSLNQATAPVRMAGLDANPGWVPALGRVINFSFVPEGWR